MPDTLDVSCPNCGKEIKVPAEFEGKRVKCKGCQEVFPVRAAAPKGKPKPAAARPEPKPAPAPQPEEKKNPPLDDDDDATPMGVVKESDIPRCPHCANEMDPPDAVVCVTCGFNTRTRVKAETKKVIAATGTDWVTHLGPGILAAVAVFALIGLDIYVAMNMGSWLEGSVLEMDEKDLTGRKKMLVKPGAFTTLIVAATIFAIVPLTRFAIRRLVFESKPEEKVKK